MTKPHDFLQMRQGSQNLCATLKESHAQIDQMTAVEYISDTELIVKAFSSLFQHDGAAAFKSSERSPLPPAASAKDLSRGRTQISNAAKSEDLTFIKAKVMGIVHLKAFRMPRIGLTGRATWIIQMTPKAITRPMLNPV